MKQLAEDVWQLGSFPPHSINAFVAGDVLFDAQTRFDGGRILKALRGRTVTAHALTHAHPDHQGASHRVCSELGVPFCVGAADSAAAGTAPATARRGRRAASPTGGWPPGRAGHGPPERDGTRFRAFCAAL